MLVEQLLLKQGASEAPYTPTTNLYAWGDMGTIDITGQTGAWLDHGARLDNNSWVAVSMNAFGVNAIRSDGSLWGWGTNGWGYGSNDAVYRSSPVQIGASSWTALASGLSHTMAIRSDGKLFGWGYTNNGQLGDGSSTAKSSPVQIGSSSWTAIACGQQHTLAIRSDGKLFAWGQGYTGVLGVTTGSFLNNKLSPVQIGSSSWTAISASVSNSMAIRSDGALFTWGYPGTVYNLGDLRRPQRNLIPTAFPTTKSWTMVSYGQYSGGGIDTAGKLWVWGLNYGGTFADGTTGEGLVFSGGTPQVSPTQIGTQSWSQVVFAGTHVVAIRSDGLLFAWGNNGFGQLGTGDTINKYSPVQIGSSSWTAIAGAGSLHVLAIRAGGTLFAWGLNTSGQLGDGTITNKSSPVQIGSSSWTAIATGSTNNSYAIRSDGALFTWGSGVNGMLGDGTVTTKSSPVQIGSSSWTAISAYDAVGAIRAGGTLFGWGPGWLGNNMTTGNVSPVQIGSSSWTAIAYGNTFRTAIRADGTLWGWGINTYGQVGDNTTTSRSSPVQINAATTWTKVGPFNGSATPFALNGGVLYTWGDDFESLSYNARFMQGVLPFSYSPVQIGSSSWTAVTATTLGGSAIRLGGTLFSWGGGANGTLGDNTVVTKSSPVQIGSSSWTAIYGSSSNMVGILSGGTAYSWGANWLNPGKNNIMGAVSTDWSPVLIGTTNQFTGGIIKAIMLNSRAAAISGSGSLYFWGYNIRDATNTITTVRDVYKSPIALLSDAGTSWIAISAWKPSNTQSVSNNNQRNLAVIRSDGKLFTWGNNAYGQLGDGTTVTKFSPVQIGSSSWTAVCVGEGYMTAIRAGGTLFAWGYNGQGQLGDNSLTDKSSPVQIGSSSWTAVSAAHRHVLAIRAGGTLFAWGENTAGKLGDGTAVTKLSPVQIGSSSWTAIALGVSHSTAIRAGGTLFAWGFNGQGQLGDGTTASKSSPVQIGSSSWTAVSSGGQHNVAIRAGGTLFTWGFNTAGQLGDGTITSKSSPVQLGSSSWTAVSAGLQGSLGKTTGNKLWAWGNNLYNAVGHNLYTAPTNISSPVLVSFNTAQQVDLIETNGQFAFATGKL